MSLIDPSFFDGELNIANTDETSVLSVLQNYIDKYEPAYLKLLLGSTLYASLIAGLAMDPVPAEWANLKNQLLVINGTSKVSPIANYVYFYLTRRSQSGSGGALMTQALYENATVIDSKIETSRVWNEMNKLSFEVYKFIVADPSDYGTLPYTLYCYGENWWLEYFWDWSFWWGWFPFNLRNRVPEIFRPINATGI